MESSYKDFNISTFICHGLKGSLQYTLDLLRYHDVVFINEHWLQVHKLHIVGDICNQNNAVSFLKSNC